MNDHVTNQHESAYCSMNHILSSVFWAVAWALTRYQNEIFINLLQ